MTLAMIAFFVISSNALAGETLYVDDDAANGGDGASWDTAYRFLQDALAEASGGGSSEIRIAQGTYKPDRDEANPNGTGNFSTAFEMPGGMSLLGGYAGVNSKNPDDRHFVTFETILSGDLLGNDVKENSMQGESLADNSIHIIVVEQNSSVFIEGFTLVGGSARFGGANEGGAIESFLADSTIIHCKFFRNYARRGGAVGNREGSVVISDCLFLENDAATIGGCVYTTNKSTLNLTNCDFIENNGSQGGSVGAENEATVTIDNCDFVGNRGNIGGGLFLEDSFSIITQCLFEKNIAGSQIGGGIRNFSGLIEIYDCDFLGNCAAIGGAGLHSYGGFPIIKRCNFIGNIDDGSPTHGVGANITFSSIIESCVFSDHINGQDGVGLLVQSGNHKITNCVFANNSGTGNGAGVKVGAGSADIKNCVFFGNVANEEGGGLYASDPGISIINCTFADNHSDIAGGGYIWVTQ